MINISKFINISQYSNYNITQEGNQDLELNDILGYYIRLCQFIGISTLYLGFLAFATYSMNGYYKKLYGHLIDYDEDDNTSEENKPEMPYEMKWFDEFDEEEEDEEDDNEENQDKKTKRELTEDFVNNLSLKTVTETTPRGDVLMYYSSKLNTFVYHSNTKEIPYKYLETVARKYVIEYKCKSLYIDIRKEYEKGVNKYKEIKEKEEKAKENKDSNENENKKKQIFANLKTYNRKGEVHNKQKDKIYILREQSNRYSYRGKIEEYDQKNIETCLDNKKVEGIINEQNGNNEENKERNKVKEIDFASFKKMYMK
jgi:hypothetical protein